MYCNQCGAKLPDDSKFCNFCGKPTVTPAEETVAAPTEETQKAVRQKPVQKAKLGEKKLFGKLPLKWLPVILGGVVVLILAIVLISNAVEEKKRTTILGAIPDPETFFGVSGDHDRYDSWHEHNIEFETADVTKDMTDAYVALLSSSEFPFVLDDTIDHFGGGMVRYIFRYNGSQELYDAKSRQIMVEYNPSYEEVVVNILNSGNFELVPIKPYASDSVSEESTGPAYAPDPEFFFNTGAAEKGDNSMTLVLSGTPGVTVFEYLSVLTDSYGMTEIDSYTEAETWQWRLQKGGDETATVSIALDKRGDGDWDLSFIFGENVTLLQAETQSGGDGIPEPEPAPEPTPTPEPIVSEPALPDPTAFLGGVTPVEDEPADTSGWHVYYRLEIDDGWTATHEYLDLLSDPRFHFELSDHFSNTVLYLNSEYYFFDYTGEESITPACDRYYSDGYQDFSSDVFIWIQKNGQDEYTSISIYYSDDLLVADLGDRASTVPGSVSGSSGGSSDSGGSNNNTSRPCNICDRTGDCQTCGGDGYLWSSASDKEDRNCYSCRNHNGKCTTCNGKGWID